MKKWRQNSLCNNVTMIDLFKNNFYRERIFNALNLQKRFSTLEIVIGNTCIFPWKAFPLIFTHYDIKQQQSLT